MNAQQFAEQMKELIQGIKDKGTAAIYCDNLITYFDEVQNSPPEKSSEVELERYKAELQLAIEQNKNYHVAQLELFRSVISLGQNAIRTSFLMNGGASVALLAFIGHLAAIKPACIGVFASSLIPFLIGVLVMTMTSGFTYLSQWLYSSEKQKIQKAGFGVNVLCIIMGLSSYVFFIWGMIRAYHAFLSF